MKSMNTNNENRTVIVAAVDRTATSEPVIHTSTALAAGIAGAELHFVYVIDPAPAPNLASPIPMNEMLRQGRVFVDELTRDAAARFSGRIAGHLAAGDAAKQILQLASDLQADVIVVGSHGKKALERLMMGSVSQAVVRKAQCAVLVARPKAYAPSDVPEIEPPCPKCLEVQRAGDGDNLWCEQHSARHAHGRLHYETPASFGIGSMFIRPES
jgi:nucleotide-binding universal stress UspA family protein